jgi:hypothetical protein
MTWRVIGCQEAQWGRLSVIRRAVRSVRRSTWLASWLLCSTAMADGAPALRIADPRELRVGERASLEVALELPVDVATPLLLTQKVEGEAVEVVRGRLMRKDARDPEAVPLVFDVPLLARAPGTSIVRVHALVYRCRETCQALELEKRVSVVVLAR